MVLRVLAVDELLELQRMDIFLRSMPEIELVGRSDDGRRAVDLIRAETPDIVLVDVQSASVNGLAVLQGLDSLDPRPAAIVLASSEQHAIRAFDAQAADYLLKPISLERLRLAIRKASQRLMADRAQSRLLEMQELLQRAYENSGEEEGRYHDELWIRDRHGLARMPVGTVELFRAEGDYVSARSGPTEHLLRDSISTLSERLDPAKFVRVHRSAIVNIGEVRKVRRRSRRALSLVLKSGEQVPVGPTYTDTVLQALGASRWR